MTPARPLPLAAARRLLALEGGGGSGIEDLTATVGRAYGKLFVGLEPLLGGNGARALFARSAKLAGLSLVLDERAPSAAGEAVVVHLRSAGPHQEPQEAGEAALVAFATLLHLLCTFIGQSLTSVVLQAIWPTAGDCCGDGK